VITLTIFSFLSRQVKPDKALLPSMANFEVSDSNGSHFFITLGPLHHLDERNVVFEEV
jgi:cyclophilin family peptidyl-prolyl cis-trans isomerase